MTPHELAMELAGVFLRKAKQDEDLIDEVLSSERVSDEIIGFHCQQAVEKLLKAVLAANQVVYRRTHDIEEIMELLDDSGHAVPGALQDIELLTPFAVDFRYREWNRSAHEFRRAKARALVLETRTWAEQQVAAADVAGNSSTTGS